MTVTVRQLAELVHGNVVGDGNLAIRSARTLQDAQPGDITFVENDRYLTRLHQSRASAAVISEKMPTNGKTVIQVGDPLMAFAAIFQHLQVKAAPYDAGIDPRAAIHPSAKIGDDPTILPFACIGANTVIGKRCLIHPGVVIGKNCRIGDDVVLFPNVVLYDDTQLGDRVILHSNTVIGADGFGYRRKNGQHVKVPQLSNVIIGNDVEIGACTTVDRGAFEPTVIGDGAKLDNHVQVAHNCKIGKHNLIAAQVGIGGSCVSGAFVIFAGQVGVADHVNIGDGAIICAKTGLSNDVEPGACVFGNPARPITTQKRIMACTDKLPEIRRDVQRIKRHLGLVDEK